MHSAIGAGCLFVAALLMTSPSPADTSSVPDDPCVTLTDSDYLAHAFQDVLKRPDGLKLVDALRADFAIDLPEPVDPLRLQNAVIEHFPGCCSITKQEPKDAFEYIIGLALGRQITDVELAIARVDGPRNRTTWYFSGSYFYTQCGELVDSAYGFKRRRGT